MSSQYFNCTEHIVEGQHIRGYAHSTSDNEEAVLHLAVKEYAPKHPDLDPVGVTIVASHASAFPKELYESIWDDLYEYSQQTTAFSIKSIWITDAANQGASGLLNAGKLGNEPSWFDNARDLLLVVNHFRSRMTRPMIGFGHSAGAVSIINVGLMHPRLFTSIIAIEPIINSNAQEMNFRMVPYITLKKDRWNSRKEATDYFSKSQLHKKFEKRTFDLWIAYGLSDLPKRACADENVDGAQSQSIRSSQPVTLTTTTHQDVVNYARGAFPAAKTALASFVPDRQSHPDLGPDRDPLSVFYRPESIMTYTQLPYLRPSCFYIYGADSQMMSAHPEGQAEKLAVTGVGVGGSGGAREGRCAQHVVDGTTHLLAFEKPREVAAAAGQWLEKELPRWKEEEAAGQRKGGWDQLSVDERARVSADWLWWMAQASGKEKKSRQERRDSSKL